MKHIITYIKTKDSTNDFDFTNNENKNIIIGEAALFTKPGFGWTLEKSFFEDDSTSYNLVSGFLEVEDAAQFCSLNEDNKIVENRKKIYFLITDWMRSNKK